MFESSINRTNSTCGPWTVKILETKIREVILIIKSIVTEISMEQKLILNGRDVAKLTSIGRIINSTFAYICTYSKSKVMSYLNLINNFIPSNRKSNLSDKTFNIILFVKNTISLQTAFPCHHVIMTLNH